MHAIPATVSKWVERNTHITQAMEHTTYSKWVQKEHPHHPSNGTYHIFEVGAKGTPTSPKQWNIPHIRSGCKRNTHITQAMEHTTYSKWVQKEHPHHPSNETYH